MQNPSFREGSRKTQKDGNATLPRVEQKTERPSRARSANSRGGHALRAGSSRIIRPGLPGPALPPRSRHRRRRRPTSYPPPYAGPRVDRNDYYTQCRRYAVANNEAFSSWRWRNGQHDDPCIPGNHCSYTCRLQCDAHGGKQQVGAVPVRPSRGYQSTPRSWRFSASSASTGIAAGASGRARGAPRGSRRRARGAKLEALDIELASLPLPSYSCVQPGGTRWWS